MPQLKNIRKCIASNLRSPPWGDFQVRVVKFSERHNGRILNACDMGCGKTFTTIAWATIHPEIRPILIVCPASVKYKWQREWRTHAGIKSHVIDGQILGEEVLRNRLRKRITRIKRRMKHKGSWAVRSAIRDAKTRFRQRLKEQKYKAKELAKHQILIINYDILHHWTSTLLDLGIQLLVVDECFPYHTLITTDVGQIPIGRIVREQLHVRVLSRNKQGDLEFRPIVRWIEKQTSERLIRVTHEQGSFSCTPRHKVWIVGVGYVEAQRLQNTHHLLMVSKDSKRSKDIRPNSENTEKPILLPFPCCSLERQSTHTIAERKEKTTHDSHRTQQSGEKATSNITVHDPQQPYSGPRGSSQDRRVLATPRRICIAWRQWKTDETAAPTLSIDGTPNGVCHPNERSNPTTVTAPLLQSGPSRRKDEDGNRSGWPNPQYQEVEIPRQTQDSSTQLSRVVCVEVLERGDHATSDESGEGDTSVFDLEIEENHNYFAEKVLVSNCHHTKERRTLRSKACRQIAARTKHVIGLSGTPIAGKPIEFFPILNMIRPDLFPSYWRFGFLYTNPTRNRWSGGWDFNGASNLDALHRRLKGIMIRYTKRQVLKDLPKKTRVVLPVSIDNRSTYQEAETEFLKWLLKHKGRDAWDRAARAEAIVRLQALRKLSAEGKINQAVEWIKNWFEETDQKLVVFAIHKSIIARLKKEFPKALVIDGSVSNKRIVRNGRETSKRQEVLDEFQTNPNRKILIGQLRAAGEGLDITAASNVLFLELGWTPGSHNQAEDRCLRIGQKNKVTCYYMVGRKTIEEKILHILEAKSNTVDRIIDGRKVGQMQVLSMYLRQAKKLVA